MRSSVRTPDFHRGDDVWISAEGFQFECVNLCGLYFRLFSDNNLSVFVAFDLLGTQGYADSLAVF